MIIIILFQANAFIAGTIPTLVPSPANHLSESGGSRALVLATDRPWYAIIRQVGSFEISAAMVAAPHHSTEAAMPQSKAAVVATTLHLQALYYILGYSSKPLQQKWKHIGSGVAGGHRVRSF